MSNSTETSSSTETWLAFACFLVLAVAGIVRARQSWRGPIFPWETTGLAAIERGMLAATATAWLFVSIFVGNLLGLPSPWPQPFLSLFLLAFFVSAGLGLSAVMLNWPKAIVPPHRRDDPGLLSSRPFRGARARPAASAPMPELPRWLFGVVAGLVLISLSGVLFLGWPPAILTALALPLVVLGGARMRRR